MKFWLIILSKWAVFSVFFYHAYRIVHTMIFDAYPLAQEQGPIFWQASLSFILFSILTVHLIVKYEKNHPRLCTWFCVLIGLVLFSVLYKTVSVSISAVLTQPFLLFNAISLLIVYEIMRVIDLKKLTKQ